jgi:DNA (cytosine-5)-methyltransferase 1
VRYLSVCTGIEAASVAWEPLGWTPVAFAEIEKFPSKVLAHHYPGVANLGDMTRFREWDIERDAVDVLVGGTPCQSFSVAGLRKGLDDPRGNLALTFIAMVDHYRPEWVIWENVPGVLSSSGGRDFGSFLGALGQLGYGFAYRVLDAQYFGVPQRRRRVFVVAHSSGDSRRAAEVLFEPESLRGDSPKTQSKEEGRFWNGSTLTQTLDAVLHKGQMMPEKNRFPVVTTGELSCLHMNATKTEIAQHVTLITPSAIVLDRIKKMNMSTAKTLTETLLPVGLRKLTPTECERLQGFPDGYTDIMPETPDGPRYKALGNSMAVPVMRWIGSRIALATK